MRHLFILTIFLSILVGQKSIQSNPISENQIGIASGIFANYGTVGMEIDGYFEVQARSGLFLESSGIAQLGEQTTVNTSIVLSKHIQKTSLPKDRVIGPWWRQSLISFFSDILTLEAKIKKGLYRIL